MPNQNPHWIDDSGPDYNPVTCITACELREIGLELPDEIPDCAWVPREAVHWNFPPVETTVDRLDSIYNGVLTITMNATFDAPFTCYRVIAPVVISEHLQFPIDVADYDDSTDASPS
jgi:hypothetical protein